MPKQVKLNKRQLKFIDYIMEGEPQGRAARLAGFSDASADRHATMLMRMELVKAEIDERLRLQREATEKAFLFDAYKSQRLLREIRDNTESSDRDRLKAAEGILDRAGFRATEAPKVQSTTNNVLSGLSEADLLALLGKGPDSDGGAE